VARKIRESLTGLVTHNWKFFFVLNYFY